jgi:hypothetical protein
MGSTIRLAQVTDTHGMDLEAAVRAANKSNTDYFIHCGDIMPEGYSSFLNLDVKTFEENKQKRLQNRIENRSQSNKDLREAVQKNRFLALVQKHGLEALENVEDEKIKSIVTANKDDFMSDQESFVKEFEEVYQPLIKVEIDAVDEIFKPEEKRLRKLEETLAEGYQSFCGRLDETLGRFNGKGTYGTWGNHDPWEVDIGDKKVNVMKDMKNIKWVAGNVNIEGLNVLFMPETNELASAKKEWFSHLELPSNADLEKIYQIAREEGKDPKEILETLFNKTYNGFEIDLSIAPDICYFHKGPGSYEGAAERIQAGMDKQGQGQQYTWGAFSEYVVSEYSDNIAFIGSGHHHGGWVGKEAGITRIMGDPNTMYIQEVDKSTGKLVALEKWTYAKKTA